MPTTLSSTPQESSVSGGYVFCDVQSVVTTMVTTVVTTNEQVSVSICDKLLGDRWSSSFNSHYKLDKASKVAGDIFTECVLMS